MCGISGIVDLNKQSISRSLIERFNHLIKHRGPDDEGFFLNNNIALGHRRLSILDLSADGHQPMFYQDNFVIIFNGEIYNYLEIKASLEKIGYKFKSKTDTEVILAAYAEWGEDCVKLFNGMWAFAILDKTKNSIFCSRDRFGVKPFYYYQNSKHFAFGSEIKQFTALTDWKAILNVSRAIDFLEHGVFDHTAETFFENVYQLKGGYNLLFDLSSSSFRTWRWYNLENTKDSFKGSFEQAKQNFKELFQSAIAFRLRSDVKVGSCLSGGLDSTSIVCTVNKILSEEGKESIQETVSSCFENKKYDEQIHIDKVVSATKVISHKVFPSFDDLFVKLEEIIWHQDEPFSSTSIFAQWHVFEEAKKNNLIVMLDGQGADEILAGYSLFYDAYFSSLLSKGKLITLSQELKAYKDLYNYSYRKLSQFLIKGFLPNSVVKKIRDSYFGKPTTIINESILRTNKNFYPTSFKSIKSASLDQLLCSNLPMLLHYEDRNSMAHSIESRVPFLDYRLVEFIMKLPDTFKIKEAKTKYILREALSDALPEQIKNRYDKMGFVTPESEWFKTNATTIREKLVEATTYLNKLINANEVMKYFDNNIEHGMEMGSLVTRVLIFYMWVKRFNVHIN